MFLVDSHQQLLVELRYAAQRGALQRHLLILAGDGSGCASVAGRSGGDVEPETSNTAVGRRFYMYHGTL